MPGQPTRGWPSEAASRTHTPMRTRLAHLRTVLKRHWLFVGPGMLSATGYIDPGNWAASLSSGSLTGYSLLTVVLAASLFAVLLQVLSARLGIVTGMDLAQAARAYLLTGSADRLAKPESELGIPALKRRTTFSDTEWRVRHAALWVLYLISELSIIATELAEIMGSAIALNLLFPFIPLWAGVLLTSVDVFGLLLLYRPEKGPPRLFELLISILVFIVLGCFVVLTVRVGPVWSDVVEGFLPSRVLLEPRPIFLGVSILGATVMPHALFLGSHVGTINRLPEEALPVSDASAAPRDGADADAGADIADADEEAHKVPLSLPVIRLHVRHASADIIVSLLGFAMCINALILIVAAAAFYRPGSGSGSGDGEVGEVGDLFDAYNLLKTYLGQGSATAFAVALLASAQCSSITVTLAGQIISEGFVRWRITPMQRRVVTRLMAMVPSFFVAASVGRTGLNEMLVVSQVALSMALPFVTLPLLLLTSWKAVMRIRQARTPAPPPAAERSLAPEEPPAEAASERTALLPQQQQQQTWASFANPWWMDVLSWATFAIICVADGFVLATGG